MTKKFNLLLFILPVMLYSLGFITILSTSPQLLRNHISYFIVGLLFYFVFMKIDFSLLKYFSGYIYTISLLLLIITHLFAEIRFGSARWIDLGPLSFQPSEFAKLAVIVVLANLLSNDFTDVNNFKIIARSLLHFLPILALVLLQPDLGTAIILLSLYVGIIFFAGLRSIYFFVGILVMGIFSSPVWHALHDYQQKRILVFLNPQLDVLGSGYNVIQSMIAVGSGGLFGKGFGRGTQSNLQFLPAYWTDFIFASFAEEWGFIGVFFLVTIFLSLLFTLLYVTMKTKSSFGKLFSFGVFIVLFAQFIINVGMNMGIMPVTGVTLPLISYGGTSLLFSMTALGIVQNIWSDT